MRYVYSVLRFVPDPARGERVNLGLLVGSDDADEWLLRLIASNSKRARSIDDAHVLPRVWDILDDLGRTVDDYADGDLTVRLSEQWLAELARNSLGVVQFTDPTPVVAESVPHVMDMLWPEFIVEPERRADARTNKHPVLAALRRAFKQRGLRLGHEYAERAVVKGRRHHGAFDFVVANGEAKQLAQGFTLGAANADELYEKVKAWAWTVQDLRESDGGEVKIGERLVKVAPNVPVAAVYAPPPESTPKELLDEVFAAFRQVAAEPIEMERAEEVADRAGSLLHLGS